MDKELDFKASLLETEDANIQEINIGIEGEEILAEPIGNNLASSEQPRHIPFKLLYIMIFSLIGFNDGLVLGYKSSLVAIFTESKVPSEERSILTLISSTFMLRIFFAPLADKYFVDWIGKRRTYIIPCKIFAFLAYFGGSFFIEGWVSEGHVIAISVFFLLVGVVLILDVNSLSGLRVDFFGRKNSGAISASQTISGILGITIGFQVFTSLNSQYVCRSILGYPDRLLTSELFFQLIAFYNLFSILLVMSIPEKPIKNFENLVETINPISTITALYRTEKLWKSIVFNLVAPTLSLGMKVVMGQFYIRKGIKREHYVLSSLVMIPMGVISNLVWIRLVKGGRLVFLLWVTLIVSVLVQSTHAFNFVLFDPEKNYNRTLVTIILIMAVDSMANWMMVQMSFYNATASKKYTVTYLSTITSIFAVFRLPPIAVIGAFVDYISMPILFGSFVIAQIVINVVSYKTVKEIDEANPKDLGIGFDEELEKISKAKTE